MAALNRAAVAAMEAQRLGLQLLRVCAERPSGFLFLRFDIDLLAVHKKIRRHQLPV